MKNVILYIWRECSEIFMPSEETRADRVIRRLLIVSVILGILSGILYVIMPYEVDFKETLRYKFENIHSLDVTVSIKDEQVRFTVNQIYTTPAKEIHVMTSNKSCSLDTAIENRIVKRGIRKKHLFWWISQINKEEALAYSLIH